MKFESINLSPQIGTEIRTDRETLLSGSKAKEIRRLLEQRSVLAFREIDLSDEDQFAFAQTLGEVLQQGEKGIFKVTLDPAIQAGAADYLKGSFYWHFDGAQDDVPALATVLSGRSLTRQGGETEFCNTYAAYDDLPASEKTYLDSVRVVHALEASQTLVYPHPTEQQLAAWRGRIPNKTHPLVWKHRSGRKSLLLGASAHYVVGMDRKESDALLDRLLDWATQPKYVYQHKWKLGDLVIWDDTGTLHRATHYEADSGRLMHRTALAGEEAVTAV